MSSSIILREKSDGSGVSACRSREDMVGRGRCNHAPGGVAMTLTPSDNNMYVLEIQDDGDDPIQFEAQKRVIQKFVDSLGKIDKKTLDKIRKQIQ